MTLRLDDLGLLESELGQGAGTAMQISLDDIDEDPDQPRREFDEASLQELAATIQARGVKQPVSVRSHPEHLGRWMLNFGARRLRAARLAGLESIPAFVDNAADSYDQVIENEQREGLKPLELALFVKARLAAGDSQAEIARRLGKSRGYVTYATAMIDAPDWLMQVYRDGRCRGARELYELRQLHESKPQSAATLVEAGGGITRQRVESAKAVAGEGVGVHKRDSALSAASENPASTPAPRPNGSSRLQQSPAFTLIAEFDGHRYAVVIHEKPSAEGALYLLPQGGGERCMAAADRIRLIGLVDWSAA